MGAEPTQFPPQAVKGAVRFMAHSVPSPNCVSITGEVRNRQGWSNVLLKPSITNFTYIDQAPQHVLHFEQVSGRHSLKKQLQQFDRHDILCSPQAKGLA